MFRPSTCPGNRNRYSPKDRDGKKDAVLVHCERCGRYCITGPAADRLKQLGQHERTAAQKWLRQWVRKRWPEVRICDAIVRQAIGKGGRDQTNPQEIPSVPLFDAAMFFDAASVGNGAHVPDDVFWADLGLAYEILWSTDPAELTSILEHLKRVCDPAAVSGSSLTRYVGEAYIPWRIDDLLARLRNDDRPLRPPLRLPPLE